MENELEEKLSSILANPEMMQKIQSMAQVLGHGVPAGTAAPEKSGPDVDLGMIQKLSSLAGQTGIDRNQQTLLAALSPYMSQAKVTKLENAMRAAKMARLASGLLGNGGLQSLIGR